MNKYFIILIIIFVKILKLYFVNNEEIPFYKLPNNVGHNHITYPRHHSSKPLCLSNNKLVKCSHIDDENSDNPSKRYNSVKEKTHLHNLNIYTDVKPILQSILTTRPTNAMKMNPRFHTNNIMYPIQGSRYKPPNFAPVSKLNMLLNNNPYSFPPIHTQPPNGFTPVYSCMTSFVQNKPIVTMHSIATEPPATLPCPIWFYEKFARSLDHFERKFYMVTFTKLISTSPPDRRVNGMSFVQSGFFLHLTLMALSLEVDSVTRAEIDRVIDFRVTDMEIENVIKEFISSLPGVSEALKFRRVSRLVLWPGRDVSPQFRMGPAAALRLRMETFNGTEKLDQIHTILNQKIETDSGGAIRDTFDEDDITGGVTAVLMTTLYFRARWRNAPTVLNGTWPFHDADDAPKRTVRLIKLNDIMGYADIKEWNAQALEIPYATPDLSLVIIMPRQPSLRRLVDYVTGTSISNITSRMKKMRVAAVLPLYTLRMTLILPNKLQAMGVSRLFDVSNLNPGDPLRLSHMVQRIMFWAEAGRNAYKDDGLEWDETPQMQLHIDRPYIFFVRWRNITLMNGNFVL